jgi:hypothetical protein
MQDVLGGVNAWKDRQEQLRLRKLQIEKAEADAKREQQIRALPGQFMRPAIPASGGIGQFNDSLPPELQVPKTGPMPAQPAGFDFQGYAGALAQFDPAASMAMKQSLEKDDTPIKLGENERLVSGKASGFKPLIGPVLKPPSLPSAVQEYNFAREQGYPGTFQQWTLEGKKAGAARTDVRIENKMNEGIAAQIGPMLREGRTAADGAAQTIDAAARIVRAIDSGQIIAGPLANARVKLSQISQMLGVSGRNEAEVLSRTREVIRGLAEMTLKGRQQMTGQGAITNSESQLAEDAVSGRIENLTAAEVRMLAKASARASKFIYEQHTRNLDEVRNNPNAAGLATFYKPLPLPQFDFSDPAPGMLPNGNRATSGPVDSLVDKWRTR